MICQAYPIYVHKGKSLQDYLDYVMDPSKVLPAAGFDSCVLLHQLPGIMLTEIFTTEGGKVSVKFVSSYLTAPEELVDRVNFLWETYKHYYGARACSGPIAYHIIISASPEDRLSDEEMHQIGGELVGMLGYPAVWTTHIHPVWDETWGLLRGMTKHSHILVSAYPDRAYEMPQKLDLGYHYERLREMADRLAIEHGYQVLVDADHDRADSYYGAMQAKKGESWLQDAREELSTLAEKTVDRGDYERRLAEHGYGLQQIGTDFFYDIPGGHQAMGHSLGREYTLEYLEARWAAMREGTIDPQLSQAKEVRGPLYVHVPLGGRFKRAKEVQRCNLQKLATNYCEWALKSYLQPGRMYDITDEKGELIRRAEGQQILDYLGCGDAAWETSAALTEDIRKRRLAWHLRRIEAEADRICERCTDSAELRYDYMCRRRWQHFRERTCRDPNWGAWDGKSLLALVALQLLEDLIPDFDSGLWRTARLSEYRTFEESLQKSIYAWSIEREEGIHDALELNMLTAESRGRYDQLAQELAEIDLTLEGLRPLLKTMSQCREARKAFDACCAGAESFHALQSRYPEVVRAYREAVSAVGQETIDQWHSVEQIFMHFRLLEAKRPMLLQALTAEFERKRKLELVQQVRRARECWTTASGKPLSDEEWASLLAQDEPRHPSLDTQIQGTHLRGEGQKTRTALPQEKNTR